VTQPCAADLPAESKQVTTDSFLATGYSGPLFLGLIAIVLILFHGGVGHIAVRWDTDGGFFKRLADPGVGRNRNLVFGILVEARLLGQVALIVCWCLRRADDVRTR